MPADILCCRDSTCQESFRRLLEMIDIDQAQKAKNALRMRLSRPPWLRGVGIGIDSNGSHLVHVMVSEMNDCVRKSLPSEIDGVPVEVNVTGDFYPAIMHGGRSLVGFGQSEELSIPAVAAAMPPSPWKVAIVTSVLGAATGWLIQEVASGVRGKRQQ